MNAVLPLEQCNHLEADTRVVRHATLSDRPVMVVAADTDVFVLFLYAFSKVDPAEKWYTKKEICGHKFVWKGSM